MRKRVYLVLIIAMSISIITCGQTEKKPRCNKFQYGSYTVTNETSEYIYPLNNISTIIRNYDDNDEIHIKDNDKFETFRIFPIDKCTYLIQNIEDPKIKIHVEIKKTDYDEYIAVYTFSGTDISYEFILKSKDD